MGRQTSRDMGADAWIFKDGGARDGQGTALDGREMRWEVFLTNCKVISISFVFVFRRLCRFPNKFSFFLFFEKLMKIRSSKLTGK